MDYESSAFRARNDAVIQILVEGLVPEPRWKFEMIEYLRPATVFDWGVNDEFVWAAYRTTSGWIAKRSKDDGQGWNMRKAAVMGDILHPRTALWLINGEQEMLGDYVDD